MTTIAQIQNYTTNRERPPIVRAADLATTLARDDGHNGEYRVRQPSDVHRPDVELRWWPGTLLRRLSTLCDRGTCVLPESGHRPRLVAWGIDESVVLPPGSSVEHEPLVVALRLVMERTEVIEEGM